MMNSLANSIKERVEDVDWRTKTFIRSLVVLSILSIALYWTLIIGYQSLSKKPVTKNHGPDPFTNIVIEAKSAFVWDVLNQRPLFEKNAYESRPLASLTKVMTAVTAARISPNLSEVTIKLADLSPEGDSKLKVATNWNVKNLTDYILLVSSNDGAHALAASAGAFNSSHDNSNVGTDIARGRFIEEMNNLARSIGLNNSVFMNEHGLDYGDKESGAYGSARDMAILFEYTIRNYPDILEATRYSNLKIKDLNNDLYNAENTNEIINYIPSAIASKTGFTDLAGGNLVVAYDAGLARPIIISVLGSSEKGRFTDMLKLVDTSMRYIQNE